MRKVAALFVGDLHFSELPPIARCVEEDWLAVQEGYIKQLSSLYFKHDGPPIFIAGDIFNKWNSSAHIISRVIHWFRSLEVWAIPGNHDLPDHNYDQLHKSAYWTLVEAQTIKTINPGFMIEAGDVQVAGFPSGFGVRPYQAGNSMMMNVALVHDYIWTDTTGYKDASLENRLTNYNKRLQTYDAVFFGDNHIPWHWKSSDKKRSIVNCGTFMRRHADEVTLRPSVWLLHTNGDVTRHYLDVSGDRFFDSGDAISKLEDSLQIDLSGFAEELQTLHTEKMDFVKVVLRWLGGEGHTVNDGMRAVIRRAIGVKQ